MFDVDEEKKRITMTEGDFGIVLPIEIDTDRTELTSNDKFVFKIFKEINSEAIIEKVFENITNNTIELSFTREESEKLEIGDYYYDLDWFQEDVFLSNILRKKKFKVNDKAGA